LRLFQSIDHRDQNCEGRAIKRSRPSSRKSWSLTFDEHPYEGNPLQVVSAKNDGCIVPYIGDRCKISAFKHSYRKDTNPSSSASVPESVDLSRKSSSDHFWTFHIYNPDFGQSCFQGSTRWAAQYLHEGFQYWESRVAQ
jgi:hypothetical protein